MLKILFNLLLTSLITSQATPLLKTGLTLSYDANGNVTTDGSIKDDGYYQAGTARSYTRNGDIVTDNVTSLQWQDSETITKPWVTEESWNAGNYNDTSGDTAATYCSELILGDYRDWRLPSIKELLTIVDNSKISPSIDDSVFFVDNNLPHWSSTNYVYFSEDTNAWLVNFYDGDDFYTSKSASSYVRCVRGEQLDNPNFFRNNTSEVVTDITTSLQWQDNDVVVSTERTWINAIDYCENLTLGGEDDWRLPNKIELLSIMDYSTFAPSIDTSVFINTAYFSWTSTVNLPSTSSVWFVWFGESDSHTISKSSNGYLRCVRGGQLDNSNSANPAVIMYLLN